MALAWLRPRWALLCVVATPFNPSSYRSPPCWWAFLFSMQTVFQVSTGQGENYPVYCGRTPAQTLAALWDADWGQAVVIADSNTAKLYAGPLIDALRGRDVEVLPLEFPAGERSKTRATKARLEDSMLDAGIERGACVVAVGGGVVLDLAGFVAATYLRGIAHINVATTLLAQVDAAIGGKTGVNTRHGKNLVGAFHQPRAVLLDTAALETLPPRELRNGLAEAVKHAVLGDAALFEDLEVWVRTSRAFPEDLLIRCVGVKAKAVAADTRDHGRRQTLNFGHTAAHAIEAATRHGVPHGEAVAAGMLVEARAAIEVCGFPETDFARLEALLVAARLPTRPQCSFEEARDALGSDKKTEWGQIRCALPLRLGQMDEAGGRWVRQVPIEVLERAWSQGGRR
jgi:3-dehydroquinate synthase